MENAELGALAAALAKAQAAFPPIVRDKAVDSRSYTFKYAPLDKIIDAVRPALSANGLAFVQMLDGDDLVTMLLHESGASLYGRVGLPREGTPQQFGSAITYYRRYALQAILGVAAEEDDDGERASGLRHQPAVPALASPSRDPLDGLIGTAEAGTGRADFELRTTPTGHRLEFRLSEGRQRLKVVALDGLAQLIAEYRAGIEGQRVTCWGEITPESFQKDNRTIRYQVLNLTRIKQGALDLTEPEPDEGGGPTEAETEELGLLAFPDPAPVG